MDIILEVFQIERIAVLLFGPIGSLGAFLQFPVSFLHGAIGLLWTMG